MRDNNNYICTGLVLFALIYMLRIIFDVLFAAKLRKKKDMANHWPELRFIQRPKYLVESVFIICIYNEI